MGKTKLLSTGGLVAGALLLGAANACASEIWNAHVDVGGLPLGLGWTVTDDVVTAKKYAATITVQLPEHARGEVRKKAPNETVTISHSASLTCGPSGMEINIIYNVKALQNAPGTKVAVKIAKVAGQKPVATGDVLAQAEGRVGQDISVKAVVPAACN